LLFFKQGLICFTTRCLSRQF